MKLGMVGLPNVGKSTLFNAITNAGAQSANYPFCTIEPNVGMVSVPDERLEKLAEIYNPDKFTPAVSEFLPCGVDTETETCYHMNRYSYKEVVICIQMLIINI